MKTVNDIIEYFTVDPMRILYFLGGSGGVWFWIGQWRDRIRLRIRIMKNGRFISDQLQENYYSQFEIENIGGRTTSLQPTVILKAYTPQRKFQYYEGTITEIERDLPPHKPKTFTINFNAEDNFEFLLFRTYIFRLRRGFSKSIRMWSASRKIISFWRYVYEVLCFKWFGKYNEPKA